jgi:hypothetical protein
MQQKRESESEVDAESEAWSCELFLMESFGIEGKEWWGKREGEAMCGDWRRLRWRWNAHSSTGKVAREGKGREGGKGEEEGEEREGEEVCDGPISKDRILSAIKELWGFPQIAGSKKKNRLAKIVKRQCQVLKRHLSRNIVVCGK